MQQGSGAEAAPGGAPLYLPPDLPDPEEREDKTPALSTHLDVPLEHAYGSGAESARLARHIREILARAGMTLAPPRPQDRIILVRGVPVAPWIPLRPAAEVWAAWLRRLEDLYATWDGVAAPEGAQDGGQSRAPDPPAQLLSSWQEWQQDHVQIIQIQHAFAGLSTLAAALAPRDREAGDVHLIGHSVGGATALIYLAGCRAGLIPPPGRPLRTIVTLDAAISGIAGIWSGARQYLESTAELGLHGLGTWSAQHGIALVTAANERDVWSHRALGDLPYVGLRLGPPLAVRAQLNGTIHGWLRRAPLLVDALWGSDSQ